MVGIEEKVPDYLSAVGVLIDLRKAKPLDRELLFRDMGMGDPLSTIKDRVDLSDKAGKAPKYQREKGDSNYNP